MNDNDGVLWLMVGLLYIVTAVVAYYGGRKVEESFWKAAIPAEMTQLCNQCRGL